MRMGVQQGGEPQRCRPCRQLHVYRCPRDQLSSLPWIWLWCTSFMKRRARARAAHLLPRHRLPRDGVDEHQVLELVQHQARVGVGDVAGTHGPVVVHRDLQPAFMSAVHLAAVNAAFTSPQSCNWIVRETVFVGTACEVSRAHGLHMRLCPKDESEPHRKADQLTGTTSPTKAVLMTSVMHTSSMELAWLRVRAAPMAPRDSPMTCARVHGTWWHGTCQRARVGTAGKGRTGCKKGRGRRARVPEGTVCQAAAGQGTAAIEGWAGARIGLCPMQATPGTCRTPGRRAGSWRWRRGTPPGRT